jgi:hypothetical protein
MALFCLLLQEPQSDPSTSPAYVTVSAPPARPPPVLAQVANPAPSRLTLPALAAASSGPGTASRQPSAPAVHPRAPVHLAYAHQNGLQQRSLTGRQSGGNGNGRAMTLGFFEASGTNDVSAVPLPSVTVSYASTYSVCHQRQYSVSSNVVHLSTYQEIHAGKTPSIRSRFGSRKLQLLNLRG